MYDVDVFMCRNNKKHGEMEYMGGGNYTCLKCDYSFHDDFYDLDEDENNESISVYDAAEIWASNGKDEEYMFGYSWDELEEALRS